LNNTAWRRVNTAKGIRKLDLFNKLKKFNEKIQLDAETVEPEIFSAVTK
jgi:hypothetical protein